MISPAGGDYSGDQAVTITDTTSSATIYYTTDGSSPSTSSAVYSGPIVVAGNGTKLTIKAIAVLSGRATSPVAVATYAISYAGGGVNQVSSPQFSPTAGSYSSDLSGSSAVAITDATSGATIYYTTDGSTPTTSSTLYAGPIAVAGNGTRMTIRAMATAAGLSTSPVITSSYTINYGQVSTPNLSLASGTYSTDQSVTLSDATSGATTYYTVTAGTTGTTPTTASPVYPGFAISVAGNGTVETIEALAVKSGMTASTVSAVTLTISYPPVSTPQILPPGGIYTSDQPVYLSTSTAGATIYYTVTAGTIGTTPTTSSPVYGGPISVAGDGTVETIEALASASQMLASSVAAASYTISRIITTFAGSGTAGYAGDGGSPTAAELNQPHGVAVDASGNLFIADTANNRIREIVAATGKIITVAGTGTAGYNGDGIGATAAELNGPQSVALDGSGDLYIADTGNNRVREVVAATGKILTVAGTGSAGYNGDAIAATAAELNAPESVAVDTSGNLFVADSANNRIREVNAATGIITTVAGTGTAGYNGDTIVAATAELNDPVSIALDSAGDLYIGDWFNNRVRKVNTSGVITTVAGNGTAGYTGDGGAATGAELDGPGGIAVDSQGDLFIGDVYNNRIRMVNTAGIIRTVVGNGAAGYSGDGGAALSAEIYHASAGVFDGSGNLYIVDLANNRVREVQN